MNDNANRIPELFGSLVFHEEAMSRYLSAQTMDAWRSCLQNGEPLSPAVADEIAEGMKTWALERGATHFTHWFQPLTGITAEKHDSFLTPVGHGRVIMDFSGKELVRGEPDASSFPSGGLRATFEARGYSAWDPTAFAFLKDGSLCIPTVFCSYSGDALDKKTPLLRSIGAVSRQAVRILRLFGDTATQKVIPQVGAEQEYFLIDKEVFRRREDLRLCGRTLFGAKPPKSQELDDHYFGSIKPRVVAYMRELDEELWRFGIYAKTKHNEAAPSQHEMAPVYTDANAANDQNQLTMELMKKVADRHGLVCLLHEKPFAGVNGSGKHNNWSLATDSGKNLFSPGQTPSQNAQFLLFLAAFLKGVDEYPELLRCTVSFAGNDHRLGGQEAPPAIISVFLGAELQAIVDSIVADRDYTDMEKGSLRIGVDVLPAIPQDTTDRNRTSPLAFTGNKFEFRMVGASQSVAGPTTILNTVMAEELSQFADALENAADFSSALHDLIRDVLIRHGRIIFNGNGYDESWVAEARRRGLPNLRTTADALPAYLLPKNVRLLTAHGVYSEQEMLSRNEIHIEKYCKVVGIEAATLLDMVQKNILPAVSAYSASLCDAILQKKAAIPGIACRTETELAAALAEGNDALSAACASLREALDSVPTDRSQNDLLRYYHDVIFCRTCEVRALVDRLEALTAADFWPYPTYCDLLFSV